MGLIAKALKLGRYGLAVNAWDRKAEKPHGHLRKHWEESSRNALWRHYLKERWRNAPSKAVDSQLGSATSIIDSVSSSANYLSKAG